MKKLLWVSTAILLLSSSIYAQSPKTATYITDEQVKAVNATGGIDHQIVSVDIGKLNEAVGIIHRGKTGAPPAGGGAGGGNRGPAPNTQPCGQQAATPPADGTPGG